MKEVPFASPGLGRELVMGERGDADEKSVWRIPVMTETVCRFFGSPCLSVMVTGDVLSPPLQVRLVGRPAVTPSRVGD